MNDQTTQLIEQLAHKLGTTTEYLWSVLVKQAAISAITNLIYLIFMIVSGFILYKVHKYLSLERGDDEYSKISYYEDNDILYVPMGVLAFVWVILTIVAFFSIGIIINGFVNPEYWALEKILSTVK